MIYLCITIIAYKTHATLYIIHLILLEIIFDQSNHLAQRLEHGHLSTSAFVCLPFCWKLILKIHSIFIFIIERTCKRTTPKLFKISEPKPIYTLKSQIRVSAVHLLHLSHPEQVLLLYLHSVWRSIVKENILPLPWLLKICLWNLRYSFISP